jgi:hypothetical protein
MLTSDSQSGGSDSESVRVLAFVAPAVVAARRSLILLSCEQTRRSARKKTPVVQFCSQPEYLPAGFQSKARGRSHGLMDSIDEGDEAPQKRARTDEDLA